MSTIAWRGWEFLAGVAAPKLVVREIAVLVIVAASLLVLRTFRERCLMAWIAGWIAYLASHHTLLASASQANAYLTALGRAEFVVAITLFATGAIIYSGGRDFLIPLLAIGGAVTLFAVAQAIYWADSLTLRFALELSYRILALAAAAQVLRFRRVRKEVGAWFFVVGLLLLHLEWMPVSSRIPSEAGILFDVLLGLGMLLVVF